MVVEKIIELTEGWKFRKSGDTEWLSATVPGCIHTDLYKHGIIKDPFYETNAKDLLWIEEETWEYKLIFNVVEDVINKNVIELQFDGIDTFATIYLNGIQLIKTNNMFHDWKSACKGRIRIGDNEIRVIFDSPYKKGLKLLEKYGFQLPANNDIRQKKVSPYIRKAPYHFGWDWGPRLVTSGIWKKVKLSAWNIAEIENIQIIQETVKTDLAKIKAVFEILSIRKYNATITIYENNNILIQKDIKLKEGSNLYEIPLTIEDPELWWPNGFGKAYLYHVNCKLSVDNEIIDEINEDIGLRSIELIRDPDNLGSSFHFEVNGKKIFIKGANIIPLDYFPSEVTKEKYDSITDSAVEANFNMIRAWGGAYYEDNYFYQLCDKKGLLIWQDFMFACGMYPATENFIESVKAEAIYNIKRLRNHPCIAIWCGNNEIVEGFQTWGWKEELGKNSEKAWQDYIKIFRELLPDLLKEYAPKKQYWPSSPGHGANEAPTLTSGDYHYWNIVKENIPISSYIDNVGRFMSEYGFKSYPELKTLQTYSKEKDWNIRSDVMQYHEGWFRGADLIETNMNREYRKPKDFPSFLYVNQVLQADAMKVAIESHRRNKPYCMGTLYWQLNDVWPTASWSSIDYFGRWKALHYFVKKLYKDLLISYYFNNNNISLFLNSDRLEPTKVNLTITLLDFTGNSLWELTKEIKLDENSNNCYFESNIDEILKQNKKENVFLFSTLKEGENIAAENYTYLTEIKNIKLPIPKLSFEISKNTTDYNIKVSTDVLAKNVFLELAEADGFFSDNYFDMLPNTSVIINLKTSISKETLEKELTIKNLTDTY